MNREALFGMDAPIKDHPAPYSAALLPVMAEMLQGCENILDPFGGEGGIFQLEPALHGAKITAIELEREWATKHPRTILGNALYLDFADSTFDAIATSPTYGNRMGDTLLNCAKYKRVTYTAYLDRPLHPDNSGKLQWGPKYRAFHVLAWTEARRVLVEGGTFVLNIKDHIRNKQRMYVTDWHVECLESLGFVLQRHEKIVVPGMKYGQNGDARVPYESVILFQLEHKP